jgi:hypothetical protein
MRNGRETISNSGVVWTLTYSIRIEVCILIDRRYGSSALDMCFFLSSSLMRGQENADARQADRSEASIQVEIVEGDSAINSIRLHSAHDPVIKVTDARGEPILRATVTFALPVSGPSAAFPDGGQSETVQTDDHGIATARGLRPNAIAGRFQVRARASLLGSTAEANVVQTSAEPLIHTGLTKLIVILIAVGGAGRRSGAASSRQIAPGRRAIPRRRYHCQAPIFGPPH